jgi:hypothetical protein
MSPKAACGASKGFTSNLDPVLAAGRRGGQQTHGPRGGLPPVGLFQVSGPTLRHVRGVHNRVFTNEKWPQARRGFDVRVGAVSGRSRASQAQARSGAAAPPIS